MPGKGHDEAAAGQKALPGQAGALAAPAGFSADDTARSGCANAARFAKCVHFFPVQTRSTPEKSTVFLLPGSAPFALHRAFVPLY